MANKGKPQKPRKRRMPVALRKQAAAAMERHRERWPSPAIEATGSWQEWLLDCPYRSEDRDSWQALMFEAFGTNSGRTMSCFLRQLANLVGSRWDGDAGEWRPDHEQLTAAINIVASVQPRNESEAALAAQMVSLHFTAMSLAKRCAGDGYPDERTAATLARVVKAYSSLAFTLAQLQGKAQPIASTQTITVIYEDRRDQRQQTVVMGGGRDSGGQAQASQCIDTVKRLEERAIVPASSTDARRPALPSSRQDNR